MGRGDLKCTLRLADERAEVLADALLRQILRDENEPRAMVLARPAGERFRRIENVLHAVHDERLGLILYVENAFHALQLDAVTVGSANVALRVLGDLGDELGLVEFPVQPIVGQQH